MHLNALERYYYMAELCQKIGFDYRVFSDNEYTNGVDCSILISVPVYKGHRYFIPENNLWKYNG